MLPDCNNISPSICQVQLLANGFVCRSPSLTTWEIRCEQIVPFLLSGFPCQVVQNLTDLTVYYGMLSVSVRNFHVLWVMLPTLTRGAVGSCLDSIGKPPCSLVRIKYERSIRIKERETESPSCAHLEKAALIVQSVMITMPFVFLIDIIRAIPGNHDLFFLSISLSLWLA